MWWNGYEGMGQWGGGAWMAVHGILPLVILILAIVGLVALVRPLFGGGRTSRASARLPGLDVLEERYARGDIQRDEYLQKKRDLGG